MRTGRLALAMVAALLAAGPAARSSPSDAGAASREVLFRARASATAVHGFYDHTGLFPVPIFNVFIPYTDASLEPGPTTEALASFLWNPQAAELGTILCVLSDGQLCDVPEYPFQARASYPAAGRTEPPPTLRIDERGAPLWVRAAHEGARAGKNGAGAEADVVRLAAIPMDQEQRSAARALATALSSGPGVGAAAAGSVAPGSVAPGSVAPGSVLPTGAGGPESRGEPGRWLLSIRNASSGSRVRALGGRVLASSATAIHDLQLLGGLITSRVVRGEVTAVVDEAGRRRGSATSRILGLRVGDFRARAGGNGVRVVDRRLPDARAEALTRALREALRGAGVRIVGTTERVSRSGRDVHATAFALSLHLDRRLAPEQLPEGTQGKDVLHVPLGYASAEAGVAQIVTVPDLPPTQPGTPAQTNDPGVGGSGTGIGGAPAALVPKAGGAPKPPVALQPVRPDAAPIAGIVDLGVPLVAVLLVAGAAVGAAVLLVWLKVNEALTE